jgi:hypothetical protein
VRYGLLADLVFALHLGFVLFVVLGGVAVLRWRRLAWLHLPAVVWVVLLEAFGWICPLTPLEVWLLRHAGESGYAGGFLARYLYPLLYPEGLTQELQWLLAGLVLALNGFVYAVYLRRARRLGKL